MSDNKTLGSTATVKFTSLSDKAVQAKVDTGATTSSLHATNIKVNGNQVSFVCEELSNNIITLEVAGSQNVVTSDNGGEARPIVKLDVEIDGVSMPDTIFNLNDRSQMELPVLIGENILQAGRFVVDVSNNQPGTQDEQMAEHVIISSEEQTELQSKLLKLAEQTTKFETAMLEMKELLRTEFDIKI